MCSVRVQLSAALLAAAGGHPSSAASSAAAADAAGPARSSVAAARGLGVPKPRPVSAKLTRTASSGSASIGSLAGGTAGWSGSRMNLVL